MTAGPLTLYFVHGGYHGCDGQSDRKLLDADCHRIQNLRAIKAFMMPAARLANLNAGVLIIAKTDTN